MLYNFIEKEKNLINFLSKKLIEGKKKKQDVIIKGLLLYDTKVVNVVGAYEL